MIQYFHRQIQLWGEETQVSLQTKKIVIIGCGGLGCSLAYALGSSGIGEIHLVDFDDVSVHNIHRQIAFKLGDEGKFKADVVKASIEDRCPFVKVHAHVGRLEAFTCQGIAVDLIIDATDNLPSRAAIDAYAKSVQTPWLYGSVEAFNGQVCLFEKSSFAAFKISDKKPSGIAAPIVMHIASLQANLALRYLAGLNVKKDFLYYLFFNDEGELVTQKFGMPV
ncbi:MAG: ThiF family adenylyltransferase [Sulfurospirillaceae bacterium]|nr:ThiF family adenylyltransferase [Sulfurospirillaceae bacterium]MDD2827213.1 ThiF family adenylyltransferase [Sulfurospirillaceae bacterium]